MEHCISNEWKLLSKHQNLSESFMKQPHSIIDWSSLEKVKEYYSEGKNI